jgi:hypothetical protein
MLLLNQRSGLQVVSMDLLTIDWLFPVFWTHSYLRPSRVLFYLWRTCISSHCIISMTDISGRPNESSHVSWCMWLSSRCHILKLLRWQPWVTILVKDWLSFETMWPLIRVN